MIGAPPQPSQKRSLISFPPRPAPPHTHTKKKQVLLLLQASDRISDDLDQLTKLSSENSSPLPATLALRRWRPLRPGREVRAFVVAGALAALCQRDVTQHVPGMEEERGVLASAVGRLFVETVGPAFAAACGGGEGGAAAAPPSSPPPSSPPSPPPALPRLHYTFDAYIHASGKARLIDINPVGGATAPLLFEWGELFPEEGGGDHGEKNGAAAPTWPAEEETFLACGPASSIPFRIVDASGAGIAPGRTLYGAPHDMVAGEAVEELARRLRRGELGPMHE